MSEPGGCGHEEDAHLEHHRSCPRIRGAVSLITPRFLSVRVAEATPVRETSVSRTTAHS